MIEKINGFWVPSNDIHCKKWKEGDPVPLDQTRTAPDIVRTSTKTSRATRTGLTDYQKTLDPSIQHLLNAPL